jgi:hypothetical protein
MNTLMSKTAFRFGIGAASIILCLALVAFPVSQAFASDTPDRGPGRASSNGDITRAPGDADDIGTYRIHCEVSEMGESGGGGSSTLRQYGSLTKTEVEAFLILKLYYRLLLLGGSFSR